MANGLLRGARLFARPLSSKVSLSFLLKGAVDSALDVQDVFAMFFVISENVDSIFQDLARIHHLFGALFPAPLLRSDLESF